MHEISKTHFHNLYSELTRIQVVKKGGVYTRSSDMVRTLVQRSFYHVCMENVISIDEKPIVIKNYKQKTVRVSKEHRGGLPSNKVHFYNYLDNLKNVYIICAITHECVLLYHISDQPINTIKFNAYIYFKI